MLFIACAFDGINTGIPMAELRSMTTPRLHLRPFTLDDAPAVQQLASERDIAATTLSIPHPYPNDGAEQWIRQGLDAIERGEMANFAITLKDAGTLIGSIGLGVKAEHERAEMGYWIGKPYWGRGYATEAARAVLQFGFDVLNLNRIVAHHMIHNPASGRILTRIGMQREGFFPQHIKKWDRYVDLIAYGIVRKHYDALRNEQQNSNAYEKTT